MKQTTAVSDYLHTKGMDPRREYVHATITYRGRVYFYTSNMFHPQATPTTIIKRQDFGRPVNPTVPKDSPTGQRVLAVLARYCQANGLVMTPAGEVHTAK